MVYLLTEPFLKAEAGRGALLSEAAADVTVLQRRAPLCSHSTVYLEVISAIQLGPYTCSADAKSNQ